MSLPSKLKNFAFFIEGVSYVGQASEIVLPTLSRKLEEIRLAGMNGPVSDDMGMNALAMEITTGFAAEHFRQFGQPKAAGVLWRFTGAWQRSDTGEVAAVEIVARGRYEEINNGTAKAGDDAPLKVKMAMSYYKLIIDGTTEIEIDFVNFVEVVGGVDRLKEQRAALGI